MLTVLTAHCTLVNDQLPTSQGRAIDVVWLSGSKVLNVKRASSAQAAGTEAQELLPHYKKLFGATHAEVRQGGIVLARFNS